MTNIHFNFRRGGGSEAEILFGTVEIKPTLAHSRSTSLVLPSPTKHDLVNGEATAANVSPTPEPVDGEIAWAQRIKVTDRHGKTYEWMVGVPDSTETVEFVSLPRYFETRPPAYGVGPQGIPGEAATVAVGTVEEGGEASVTNSGTNTDAVLNFVLPEGPQGPPGDGVNVLTSIPAFADLSPTYPSGYSYFALSSPAGTDWPFGYCTVQTIRRQNARTVQTITQSNGMVWTRTDGGASLAWTTLKQLAFTDLATTAANGLMSSADKSKLDNVGEVAYNTKTLGSAPSTYPEGTSSGVMRVDAGWPEIAGATFTLITTSKAPSPYNSAIQWASPHFGTDSANKDAAPTLFRVGTNADTWGAWQTVVSSGNIQTFVPPNTSSYASVEEAFAANSNKSLVFNGDYTVSANIPNFWTVALEGAGTITRGSTTFTVNPVYSLGTIKTNNLYVDASTGNDANDGLTPDYAFKTIARMQERLSRITEDQAGGARWIVNLKGVFNEGVKFGRLQSFRFGLYFRGEAGAEPTTVIQKGATSANIGLHFEPGATEVILENLKFKDFSSTLGYAVLMKYGGFLRMDNCVAENCTHGFAAIQNVQFYMNNCRTLNVGNGFRIQYNSTGNMNNCKATNSSSMGFSVSRNAVVHIDYCEIVNCNVGVLIDMASRANVLESNFKRNSVGVSVQGAAEWINASSVFNIGTADANTVDYEHLGAGRETRLYSTTARNEYKIGDAWTAAASYQNPREITGSTSNTVVYVGTGLGSVPENFFKDRGKRLRVVVYGNATLTANATLRLYAQDVSGAVTLLTSKVLPSSSNNSGFQNEFIIWARSATSQSNSSSLVINNNGSSTHWETSSADFSVEKRFRVYCQLGNASDSVTFYQAEVFLMG